MATCLLLPHDQPLLGNLEYEHLLDVDRLLSCLGPNVERLEWDYLCEVVATSRVAIARPSSHRQARVIGIACLAPLLTLTRRTGLLTHIAVEKSSRRRGIGTQLVQCLITEAQKMGLQRIDLTSRKSRQEAQMFWLNLGFMQRETNNFRLEFM